MQVYLTLLRRELGSHFLSMTGYVIISTVLGLVGFSIMDILPKLSGKPMDTPITEMFYVTIYFWIILLLTTPVITMRTFAQEKFSGTFETLMTAPVSDLQVVLAKFSAGLMFFMAAWAPVAAYIVFLHRYTNLGAVSLQPAVIASTYLGLALIGGLFISLGCFASSLTKSQLIASAVSCGIGVMLFLLSMRSLVPMPMSNWEADVFAHLSMTEHLEDFARGIVSSSAVAYYVTATGFFLYLTLKVVESRRWK